MTTPRLALLATASALITGTSEAYVPSVFGRQGWVSQRTIVSREAVIYQPDWDGDSPNSVIREEEESSSYGPLLSDFTGQDGALADFIQRDSMDALARLAVVFSQADRKLELQDIDSVQVLGVDEHHITIQAVLCEDDGCVTLAVPISFPQSCRASGDFNSCVLDNIHALDQKAHDQLRKKNWENENHETLSAMDRQLQTLKSDQGVEHPGWWVDPRGELVDECTFLKDLLNEDEFAGELSDLAVYTVKNLWGQSIQTEQAAVALVGPAGIILRASYREGAEMKLIQVPVSFSQVCMDGSSLRAAVLGAVAQGQQG